MFRLDKEEAAALRSQIATSNIGRGGRRYAPYVFTEQGVAMLSSVLRSAGADLRRTAPADRSAGAAKATNRFQGSGRRQVSQRIE
jgi:hypothetical protein